MQEVRAVEFLTEDIGKPLLWLRRLFTWKLLHGERLLVISLLQHRLTGRVEIFCNGELRRRTALCAFCSTCHTFNAEGLDFTVERFASGFMLRVDDMPFENLTGVRASVSGERRSAFLPLLPLDQLPRRSLDTARPQDQNWFESEINGLADSPAPATHVSRFLPLEQPSP